MVIVTAYGFNQGNPDLVLYPYDEDGRQCGRLNNTLYPYLYLYNAVSDVKSVNITNITRGVCVTYCPTNYTGYLSCLPTKNNANCSVTWENFYVSTECK